MRDKNQFFFLKFKIRAVKIITHHYTKKNIFNCECVIKIQSWNEEMKICYYLSYIFFFLQPAQNGLFDDDFVLFLLFDSYFFFIFLSFSNIFFYSRKWRWWRRRERNNTTQQRIVFEGIKAKAAPSSSGSSHSIRMNISEWEREREGKKENTQS